MCWTNAAAWAVRLAELLLFQKQAWCYFIASCICLASSLPSEPCYKWGDVVFLRYWWLHGRKLYWQTRLVFFPPLVLIFMLWLTVSCNVCSVVHYLVPPVSVSGGLEGDFCPVHHVVCLINKNMAENSAVSRIIWNVLCSYQLQDFPLHPQPPPPLWWLLSSLSRSAVNVFCGVPLSICWPGLGFKGKKMTVGTRCTTPHLLHPIRLSLTSGTDFMSQYAAILHYSSSGKCHMA